MNQCNTCLLMNEYNNREQVYCHACYNDLGFDLHLQERKTRRAMRAVYILIVAAIVLVYALNHGWCP